MDEMRMTKISREEEKDLYQIKFSEGTVPAVAISTVLKKAGDTMKVFTEQKRHIVGDPLMYEFLCKSMEELISQASMISEGIATDETIREGEELLLDNVIQRVEVLLNEKNHI